MALLSALLVTAAPILPAGSAQASAPNGASSQAASQVMALLAKAPRPRVIATTDGEQDDLASMHRFILYTDELDVAGIIQSSSRFHHAGDAHQNPPIASRTWLGSDWIHAIIRNYAKAYPQLRQNDPRYPTP